GDNNRQTVNMHGIAPVNVQENQHADQNEQNTAVYDEVEDEAVDHTLEYTWVGYQCLVRCPKREKANDDEGPSCSKGKGVDD
ncbi:hypothetical protein A2U01_0031647, partial [Trifolium medium]|nr:hypothetical protein [Trifolium medium]